MIGFVIGNGESRLGCDLEQLRPFGPIYGCNALYRDFIPDVLVAVDERMVKEIKEAISKGLKLKEFVYREKANNEYGRILVASDGFYEDKGYAAGTTALKLLCARHPCINEVYLVGFDIYSIDGVRNNVYKGTMNYAAKDALPVYPMNWIEKLARVFVQNPATKFYRVTSIKTNPPEWSDVDNVFNITYEQMFLRLKGGGNEINNG